MDSFMHERGTERERERERERELFDYDKCFLLLYFLSCMLYISL